MDPKFVPEVVGILATLKSDAGKKLLLPLAEQLGFSLGDIGEIYRFYQNEFLGKIFTKWEASRGNKPLSQEDVRKVMPLLQLASVQSDDELQTMWATLLENTLISTDGILPSSGRLSLIDLRRGKILRPSFCLCFTAQRLFIETPSWQGTPGIRRVDQSVRSDDQHRNQSCRARIVQRTNVRRARDELRQVNQSGFSYSGFAKARNHYPNAKSRTRTICCIWYDQNPCYGKPDRPSVGIFIYSIRSKFRQCCHTCCERHKLMLNRQASHSLKTTPQEAPGPILRAILTIYPRVVMRCDISAQ